MRSVSSSISWSEVEGEFKTVYELGGKDESGVGLVVRAGAEVGNREKREEDGVMKDKYWSETYGRQLNP